ncbi:MAG: hypothetical protein MZV65_45450 [Chromatiales bacterium]|nr:hypothetical protein [Chromatiales bacterium]
MKRILADKGVPFGEAGRDRLPLLRAVLRDPRAERSPSRRRSHAYYEMVTQEALSKVALLRQAIRCRPGGRGAGFHARDVQGGHRAAEPGDQQPDHRPRRQPEHLPPKGAVEGAGHPGPRQGAQAARRLPEHGRDRRLCRPLHGRPRAETRKKPDAQLKLFEDYYDFHGPQPELCRFETLDRMVAGVADRAAAVDQGGGVPFSEVAVLFALKKPDRSRPEQSAGNG